MGEYGQGVCQDRATGRGSHLSGLHGQRSCSQGSEGVQEGSRARGQAGRVGSGVGHVGECVLASMASKYMHFRILVCKN